MDPVWRKSKKSAENGGCVEVATLPECVLVRDSKNPDGARLQVSYGAWRDFLAGTRERTWENVGIGGRTG